MNEPLFADVVLEVSDFVALLNQTFEYVYPGVTIRGELANFRVSKNKWVYFDLKDETATVRFFGTVFQLTGPLEDGMLLRVRGTPRLHPQYGFERHKGYGTPEHLAALAEHGPCVLHRRSFAPVREAEAALERRLRRQRQRGAAA